MLNFPLMIVLQIPHVARAASKVCQEPFQRNLHSESTRPENLNEFRVPGFHDVSWLEPNPSTEQSPSPRRECLLR